jgi:hypothetical protein
VETVKQLLAAEGTSIDQMEVNQYFEYDGGEHIHDLVIEKIGENRMSVGQYYTQRMDQMHAPEVVFDTSNSKWTPVEYTNHDTTPQIYEADENGVDGLDSLLETWNSNLQSQFNQYLPDQGEHTE